jgi:hypothetical protein
MTFCTIPERQPYPIAVLPPTIKAMVQSVADATETPIELGAMLVLPIISTAVQRRVQVSVRDDWREELASYSLILLDSGEGKTPVFRHLMEPIIAHEKKLRKEWQDASEEQKPPAPRVYTSDATAEKLAVLLSEQGQRLSVLSAEGGLLDVLGGRYAPRGQTGSLDLFLKAWGGEPVIVDRQKAGASVYLERPVLSIGLTAQPTVLEHLANGEQLTERGLLARFLICVPSGKVGTRLHPEVPACVKPMVQAAYETTIGRLFEVPDGTRIGLQQQGYAVLARYRQKIEPLLLSDYAPIKATLAKTGSHVVRIAALLALAADPCCTTLDADAIERAITLHEWLIPHQLTAAGLHSSVQPVVKAARTLAGWLEAHARRCQLEGELIITLRQAQQYTKLPRIPLLEALTLLDEVGIIEELDTKRRDSHRYRVPDVTLVQQYVATLQP